MRRFSCYRIVHDMEDGNMEGGDNRSRDFPLPQGFESTEWSEDGPASFIDPESGLILLVDEANPSQRRFQGAPRFTLYEIDPFSEPSTPKPLICSDDYDAVIRVINDCKRGVQNPGGTAADPARLDRSRPRQKQR